MTETVEIRKGLTVKSFAIGSIIIVLLVSFIAPLSAGEGWGISITGHYGYLSIFFWVAFIAALINMIKPGFFSPQELTVIFAMVSVGMAWWSQGSWPYLLHLMYLGPGLALTSEPAILELVPRMLWGPADKSIVEATFLTSTWKIYWEFFLQPMGISLTILVGMLLSSLFLSLLLKHSLIYREALTFPFAMPQTELIKIIDPEKKPLGIKARPMKMFWIGWLVYFVLNLHGWAGVPSTFVGLVGGPLAARAYSTALAPFSTLWGSWNWPGQDWTRYGILPWTPFRIPGGADFLRSLTFMMLMPFDVIIGALFGWLILVPVSMGIQVAIGALPPFPTGISSWATFTRFGEGVGSAIFSNYWMGVQLGILFAILIFPSWVNRSYVKRLFKAIMRPDPELDAESPMPLRYIWWGLILSTVIWIAGWIWFGIFPIVAVLFQITILLYLAAGARVIAEGGGHPPIWTHIGGWIDGNQTWPLYATNALLLYGFVDRFATDPNTAATIWILGRAGANTFGIHLSPFLVTSLTSWKVGHDTKTSDKDLLKAILIAGLASIVIALIAEVITIHVYSYQPGSPAYTLITTIPGYPRALFYPSKWMGRLEVPRDITGVIRTFNSIIVGLAYGLACYMLRARFLWFRVNPVGTVLLFGVREFMFWLPFVFALIIKGIIIRFTKPEFYENYVKPFCIGFFLSTYTTIIFGLFSSYMWRVHWWWA